MTRHHDEDPTAGSGLDPETSHDDERDPATPRATDAARDAERVGPDAERDEEAGAARGERRSDVVIVTLVFVVLYGYDLLEAIANLQGLPAIYAAAGIEGVPWAVLVAGVAAPPLAFAAASALARGRRLAARAGILLVGLGVSAQLALLLEELARRAAVAAFGG